MTNIRDNKQAHDRNRQRTVADTTKHRDSSRKLAQLGWLWVTYYV